MRNLLTLLLLAWAIAFFGAFVAFYLTPARDFGLSAGWNKVAVFLGWQAVATLLALACMVLRWTVSDRRMRRLAAIPALAVAVLLSVLAIALIWAYTQRAPAPSGVAPDQPTRPVTAPAEGG